MPRKSEKEKKKRENPDFVGVSDEDLLAKYVAGDAYGLLGLMERHKGDLEAYVAGLMGERRKWLASRVEDVSASVWVVVSDKAADFGHRSSFKTWLFGIAINVARDHMKSLLRRARQERQAGLDDEGGEATWAVEADPRATGPGRVERCEVASEVDAALATLPEEQRAVFERHARDDESWNEIGAALGLTRPTLRSRLRQATTTLRALLKSHAPALSPAGEVVERKLDLPPETHARPA